MRKRALLTAILGGTVLAAGAFLACSSSSSGSGDAGMDSTVMGLPDVITVFETSPADVPTSMPEAGPPPTDAVSMTDVVTPPKDTGADHVVVHQDAGVDASHDTGACTPVTVPMGTDFPACPTPVTTSCAPGSLVGFTPTVGPPSGLHQNLCTTAQISSIYTDCFTGTQPCPEEESGNAAAACYSCIITYQTDMKWGPIVLTAQGIANVNTAGCVSMLEPCNSACAAAIGDDFVCDNQACGANCVAADNDAGSLTPFQDCANTVDGCDPNGCFAYYNGAYSGGGCINQLTGAAHPASACFPSGNDFQTAFEAVSAVFCGP